MKKNICVAICILGLLGLSSCRSTSAPCGLANHSSDQTEELKLFMESDSFYLLESL